MAGARGIDATNGAGERVLIFLRERFHPSRVLGQLILYSVAVLYGTAIAGSGELALELSHVAGAIAFLAFLLTARVFDEHKDYEYDVEYLPDRPLPRRAVSWRDVNGLGAASVAVQVGLCLAIDGGFGKVTLWWAIAFTYLFLTRYEFFVQRFLRTHFITNTIVHLPVYTLAMVWSAQIGAAPERLSTDVIWLAALTYTQTFAVDFWRKSHAPEDEREGVYSYTGLLGTTGASVFTGVLVLGVLGLAAVLLSVADAAAVPAFVVLALLPIPLLLSLMRFVREPSRETNEPKKKLLMLTLLASHVTVIVTLAVDRGLS